MLVHVRVSPAMIEKYASSTLRTFGRTSVSTGRCSDNRRHLLEYSSIIQGLPWHLYRWWQTLITIISWKITIIFWAIKMSRKTTRKLIDNITSTNIISYQLHLQLTSLLLKEREMTYIMFATISLIKK